MPCKNNLKSLIITGSSMIIIYKIRIELRQRSHFRIKTRRDKGGKYGEELNMREIRQRTVSARLLVLFLIREKWKCPRESGRARYQVA